MFLQSVTAKKINHPKLPTKQDMLRRHLMGYGAPTACSACKILAGFSVGFLRGLATWNKKILRFLPQKQGSGNPGVLALQKLSFRLCNTEPESLKSQLTQPAVSRPLSHNWSLLCLDLKSHMEAVESGLSSSISFINKTFQLFPKHFFLPL